MSIKETKYLLEKIFDCRDIVLTNEFCSLKYELDEKLEELSKDTAILDTIDEMKPIILYLKDSKTFLTKQEGIEGNVQADNIRDLITKAIERSK